MDGVNYLVPVDARLERDVDVRFETVTVDDLLVSTSGASLRLVILDACRNNPLARSMQRTAATRTVSGGSFGLELDSEALTVVLSPVLGIHLGTGARGRGKGKGSHRKSLARSSPSRHNSSVVTRMGAARPLSKRRR